MIQPTLKRFAELTWSEYEVEVTLGELGSEGTTQRRVFQQADEVKEFIEDWLEQLTMDGFVEGEITAPVTKPLPYPELVQRAQKLPSLGACIRDDDDVIDEEEEEVVYPAEDEEDDTPEYEVRRITSLTVDEAFDERIKEDPYDIDP